MVLPIGIKAVNLGCGIVVSPGWINIDNSPNARLSKYPLLRWSLWKLGVLRDYHYAVKWPESIIIRDVRKGMPFPDSSIDYVYTSHFLEHLTFSDSQKLIANIFRVLKSQGIVRIVVPDLAYGARQYLSALRKNPNDPQAAPKFLNWMQLGKAEPRDPHLWMYDIPSLSALLIESGFINVTPCSYRQGRVPDCEALDNRPDDSLHIEAEKP